MKRNYTNLVIILLIILFLLSLLLNSKAIFISSSTAFNTWLYKVLPYLLPMFIISDLLLNYNFPYYLTKLLKFTKINPNLIFIFFMSMISGFPSSAKYIKEMYLNNYISKDDAENALVYCYFPNPLFLVSMCQSIFKNNNITILIFLILYFINIIFFIFFKSKNIYRKSLKKESLSFNEVLAKSIPDAINTLFIILGCMILFSIVSSIISSVFHLNPILNSIVLGLLEFSQGLNVLINLEINDFFKMILTILFASFGGACVQIQIKSILTDTNLSLKKFYLSKIILLIFIMAMFFLKMLF